VSVVILNWNGREVVCETIRSVLGQNHPIWEIVVVDNASTDGSATEIAQRFPQVRIIQNQENYGFAAGNNIGIVQALDDGAECVLLLNNDARLEPSTLRVMVSAMLADPHRGVIVPKIYIQDDNQSRRIWAAGAKWKKFPPRVVMRGYKEIDRGQYDTAEVVNYATGCVLLIHRKTFESVGLLDESYFMYQEDYAYCDQVRKNDLLIWYEPKAIVHHLVSSSTGKGSPKKWRYWSRGQVLFYLQHYDLRWKAIASLLIFVFGVIIRESIKGKKDWFIPLCQGLREGCGDARTGEY
jgi:hypothetical protein